MNKKLQTKIQEILGLENLNFSTPPKPEMGDLAIPCFELSKKENKNPAEFAKDFLENFSLPKGSIIKEMKAFGPYINLFLDTSEVSKLILPEVNEEFGNNNIGQGKKVLIEYPSQNTHKEFHIGHMRNVCVGNTIVQVYRASGYDMTAINYVNDFGRHVVKCLWGILHSEKLDLQKSDIFDAENKQKMLGELYAKASNYLKDQGDEYNDELNDIQNKLENKEEEITKLFEETKKWSTDGFANLMAELKVDHDSIIYESEVKARGQEIVDELLEKKIAEVGEGGAIIVDLNEYNLDVALVRKSSGGGVYMTSDLALAEEKFKRYDIEESINITATEQNFYFKQMYKVLGLNGFGKKLTHIGYGLVNLPSGKMASRAGNVILYEDLRDKVMEHLQKETKDRHEDWEDEKIKEVSHTLAMAVLKFTMQKHEADKVVTFDFDEALSFDGFSAPYILYTVARINSLGRKFEGELNENIDFNLFTEDEAKNLVLKISELPEVVEKSLENYNSSVIAKYAFDLAKLYNDFYNKHSILNAKSKELVKTRLYLSKKVAEVLTKALGLLTIDTLEEM